MHLVQLHILKFGDCHSCMAFLF